MKNEFCTYEQALALKELGYDEPCFGDYYKFDNNDIHLDTADDRQRIITDNKDEVIIEISAPLYQQAFRWFREKYGLDSNTINTNMWTTFSFVINDVPNKNPITTYLDFNTHEEAESACLDKLIEICKTK